MTRPDRLLRGSILLVQLFRVANIVAVLFFVAVLIATLPGAELIEARLASKYRDTIDPATVVTFVQVMMLLSLPVGYAIDRLFAALRAILQTVQDGEPFVGTNAARLRTIGWMLLIVQFADLAYAAMTVIGARFHIDYFTWQPSFTGWIAVLIAFILAQVFERGAAMQGDLEGTV